jgi:quercetin dioxygenase-like cupin family protein
MEPDNYHPQQSQSSLSKNLAVIPEQPVDFSLGDELEALRNTSDWLSGIARKKLIQYPDLQISLRRMRRNTRIPEHYNPGRICVQTVFGHIRMHADGRTFDLPSGKCLVLDRAVIHDVEAVDESAFLLTVAHNQEQAN